MKAIHQKPIVLSPAETYAMIVRELEAAGLRKDNPPDEEDLTNKPKHIERFQPGRDGSRGAKWGRM